MDGLDSIKIAETLSKHTADIKSLEHRVNDMEKLTDAIHDMTTAVKVMEEQAKSTGKKVDEMSQKIERMESKPSEKAEKLKDSAMASLVNILLGAFIGALLSLILKGL